MASKPKIDIGALAALARVEISNEEITKFEHEIPNILAFVETIQNVDISAAQGDTNLRNVMREDEQAHESGIYTEKLLAQAPHVKDGRIVVKQVISRKKA
jgi:aspartyl-tRNA(Asn)/glutamyl-tRNA(Gln) amidotransferase subunit C